MSEELQQLLEKIQQDGVNKANAEAAKIIAKAKADAETLIKEAEEKAAGEKARAEAEAKAFSERAGETIRQAARDTVLSVEAAVTKLLEAILVKDVKAVLADPESTAPVALEAIKALVSAGDTEVAADEKLADALRAALNAAAVKGVTVVTDETLGTGFSVRLDGGRVEHDFTGSAVAEALAKRLRPALAKLVR